MCRLGRYNLCEKSGTPGYRLYGHTAPGALAEFAVRPAQMLHKLPDSAIAARELAEQLPSQRIAEQTEDHGWLPRLHHDAIRSG